jgi:hypothetical protein
LKKRFLGVKEEGLKLDYPVANEAIKRQLGKGRKNKKLKEAGGGQL